MKYLLLDSAHAELRAMVEVAKLLRQAHARNDLPFGAARCRRGPSPAAAGPPACAEARHNIVHVVNALELNEAV